MVYDTLSAKIINNVRIVSRFTDVYFHCILTQKMCQKVCVPQKSCIFAPLLSNVLGYGVMVTLQILVLPFLVRVRVAQQQRDAFAPLFFCCWTTRTRTRKGGRNAPFPFPFFNLLRKCAPFHFAWRPSGSAVSLAYSLAPIRLHLRKNTILNSQLSIFNFCGRGQGDGGRR